MTQKIYTKDLIAAYKDSHGEEGAIQLLNDTKARLGIPAKEELTKEEARQICLDLQNKTGFVGIVAGILLSRLNESP